MVKICIILSHFDLHDHKDQNDHVMNCRWCLSLMIAGIMITSMTYDHWPLLIIMKITVTSRETPALARRRPIGWSRRTSSRRWVRSEWTCKHQYIIHQNPSNTAPAHTLWSRPGSLPPAPQTPVPEWPPVPPFAINCQQCSNSICQNTLLREWFIIKKEKNKIRVEAPSIFSLSTRTDDRPPQ